MMKAIQLEQWKDLAQAFHFQDEAFCYWDSRDSDDSSEPDDGDASEKPALLLIHGFPSASWDWSPMWQSLSEQYRLIAVDMLGFGLSSKSPKANYSIFFQADLQQALLQHLNIGAYSILAHDYGDTVAQELLARDLESQQIQQAFLLNGGLFPETHRALPIQKLMLSPLGFLLPYVINPKAFARSFERICAKPLAQQELDTLWQLLRHHNGHKVMPKLIRYITERRQNRERWVSALQNTQANLVLINGSLDPISGSHMVERFRELVQEQDIFELPQLGHYPQLEDPQQVCQVILNASTSISR